MQLGAKRLECGVFPRSFAPVGSGGIPRTPNASHYRKLPPLIRHGTYPRRHSESVWKTPMPPLVFVLVVVLVLDGAGFDYDYEDDDEDDATAPNLKTRSSTKCPCSGFAGCVGPAD